MHCSKILFLFLLLFSFAGIAQVSDEKITTESNIGMTLNNLGLFGNAFRGSFTSKNFPSCEFPRGSNVEHVFQGGLWVGARKTSISQPFVSTMAFGSSSGYTAGASNFEFTARPGSTIGVRSSLKNKSNYSAAAISHQDLSMTSFDTSIFVPGTSPRRQIPDHNPIGLQARLESYNWNFPFANFFVILNYKVTNISSDTLKDVYFGLWADGVVRNVSRTPPGGTPFFDKGGNGFIDSLYLGYEFDATGDPGFSNSYVGFKFLGADSLNNVSQKIAKTFSPKCDTGFRVWYNGWSFNNSDPAYPLPSTEVERYRFMQSMPGLQKVFDQAGRTKFKAPGNRSSLISAGPFKTILPGATVSAVFAVVCAKKDESEGKENKEDTPIQKRNLVNNAIWAQSAYLGNDINGNCTIDDDEAINGSKEIQRFLLPEPPEVPKTKVIARPNAVDIFWSRNAENSIDPISRQKDFEGYKIYKSNFGFDMEPSIQLDSAMKLLASYDLPKDGIAFDNGFETIKLPNDTFFENDTVAYTYKYTMRNLQSGWQHIFALTAFDKGDANRNLPSLETGVRSNFFATFPGTTPNRKSFKDNEPFVYPNPYFSGASWEGTSLRPEDKKLLFANLPARCKVKIFTTAGDLVDQFNHDASTYKGEVGWYSRYSSFKEESEGLEYRILPGGEHAWDLLSKDTQIIARGLYLFTVEDMDNGNTFKGKFVIIK